MPGRSGMAQFATLEDACVILRDANRQAAGLSGTSRSREVGGGEIVGAGWSATDRSEHRKIAGAVEPPSDVGSTKIKVWR